MPIKKDETGKRWVEMHFVVPGMPEQVWMAMATGAGNAAWFTQATIEERVGGVLKFHFGPEMMSSGEVTRWEPPYLFGYVERQWCEGAPPIGTEITISSRANNECAVRMTHSLFSASDQWDGQMESFEQGWQTFIEVLRIYLAKHAGMRAASFQVMKMIQSDGAAAWSRVLDRMNLAGANVGETRDVTGPEKLSCTVERIHQDRILRGVIVQIDKPHPAIAIVGTHATPGGVNVHASVFMYGDDAESRAAEAEPRWREWWTNAVV